MTVSLTTTYTVSALTNKDAYALRKAFRESIIGDMCDISVNQCSSPKFVSICVSDVFYDLLTASSVDSIVKEVINSVTKQNYKLSRKRNKNHENGSYKI